MLAPVRSRLGLHRALSLVALCSVPAAGCGTGEPAPATPAPGPCPALGDACTPPSASAPAVSERTTIVPSAAMPPEVVSQTAHNNLDIAWHDGRLFFAFRTAPSHFASELVTLYVVSTADHERWRFEGSFQLGKDLREPRLLSVAGKLFLYFAVLSEIPLTFVPERTVMSEWLGPGSWTPVEDIFEPGFIPWRARNLGGVGHVIGYVGGESIYENEQGGVRVHWLTTTDGRTFEPFVAGRPVVLAGGSSETDLAFLDDGGIVAVSRNEAGDELGWGSKICRATASALGDWECVADPKKYDSPIVFRHGSEVYLIGRRQVANDGKYDLGDRDRPPSELSIDFQKEYWTTPKRCSLWKVDPASLTVSFVLDLPSSGDTCFASVVPLGERRYLVYNYTSDPSKPDTPWLEGQGGPTEIYRVTLTLP